MPTSYNMLYSKGAAKVGELSGVQYTDDTVDSLDLGILLKANAGVTLGASTTFDAGNNKLTNLAEPSVSDDAATKNYVDTNIGGATQKIYTVASATGLVQYTAVAIGTGTNAPLLIADKDSDLASNAIGVITLISGLSVTVQLNGEVQVSTDLSGRTVGDPVYIGDSGAVVFTPPTGGAWVTLLGYVSDVASDKITLQPRTFGQSA